jgi:hypothetical protein
MSNRLAVWLQPFGDCFTVPTWRHVLVLIAGAILSPGRRTVAAALRVVGLEQGASFTNYHRVLNRNSWSSRRIAGRLLQLLVSTFVPDGPVIIGLDDTLERRWGSKIKARGIYRDPVRSSHGHFVKASGLRWLCVMLLPHIPWAGRVWGLPFLTALAPSERYARQHQRRHKKLTDWGRQTLLQIARWLPGRQIIAVTDSSYAAIDLLNAVRRRICMITRLRLDARLFDPPARRRPSAIGRPRVIGRRQPTLAARLADPKTRWERLKVTGWYGRGERLVDIVSATAIWLIPAEWCPSVTCWSATSPLNSSRRHSCALISTQTRSISSAGSFAAGRLKSRLPRSDAIWELKLSDNGQIPRSLEQRPLCSGCSR